MNRRHRFLPLFFALLLAWPLGAQETPARPATANEKVSALLGKYARRLEALLPQFARQASATEKSKPALSPEAARQLAEGCSAFFRELASSENGPPLDRVALQSFKQKFPGGGAAWEPQFLAVERALMMGRAQLVNQLWLETIGEYTQANPDKAAYIIGEIDIGSWIQMRLADFDFAGDIDFSSSTTDVKVNRDLVKMFEGKLVQHTGLDMVQADALLTPHGDASNHVFIDDWGKAYAEMELLRPGAKVKILELDANKHVVLENGRPKFRLEPGEVLLWEAAARKDGAVELPKIGIEREPMLSLEMYRHEIHDISNGPFANAQKITKVMKYLERSFSMNDKALAAFRSSMPEIDPAMRGFADAMIAAKKQKLSGPEIHDIVSQFAQAELGETLTPENYGSIVLRIEARAQTAMLDNSCRAISARFNQLAAIVAEPERRQALNQFWTDLQKETAALRASHIDPPAILDQAVKIAQDVENAKLPPAELAKRAAELRGLLEDSYKLTPSVIDRIMKFDPYGMLRDYLREKCKWQVEWVDKFIAGTREKYPNAAALHDKVTAFNNEWNQSLEGSKLMSSMDFADNAIQLFDVYQTGRTHADGLVQASWALAKLKVAGHFPTLALGKSLLDAYEQGDPTAAGMAIGFYYFPTVGAFYQTSQHLQRFDAFGKDENFAKQVAAMQQRATFDKRGRMTKITLKIGHGEDESLSLPDSDDPEVRAEAFAKFFINGGDLGDLISGNPAFRYWATLVPRESWEFGAKTNAATAFGDGKGWDFSGYSRKMENLRKHFPNSAEIAQLTLLLQDVRSRPAPQDKNTAARNDRLQQIENAIEVGLWKGLFSLLEAAACPALAQMEEELKQLEYELRAGDLPLVPRKGIVTRAKAEIAARQSWTQTIDFNSKFIFTHYLESYRKVKRIQQQVQALWTADWGVNWVAITSPPLKNLLTGELEKGAPRLTCAPDDDVKLAEACLAAHRARQEKMLDHLRFALNRPIDPAKDRPLLLQIAQLEFEIEHILDDSPSRKLDGLSPESEALRKDRMDKLNALLAKIGQANLKLSIEGRTVSVVGKPVSFRTHIEGFNASTSAKFRIEWDNKLGAGHSVGLKPDKPGEITLRYTAYGKTRSGGEAVVGKSTPLTLFVIADPYAKKQPKTKPELAILARGSAKIGEKVPLLAKITNAPADAAKIVIKWSDETRKLSMGRGERALFTADKVRAYLLKAQVVATDVKGVETTLAEATHTITATLAPPEPVAPAAAPVATGEPAITIDFPREVVAGVPFTVTARIRGDILSRAEAVFVNISGMGTTGGYTAFYDAGANLRATSGNCIFPPGGDEKLFQVAVDCTVYDRFRRGAPNENGTPGYKTDRHIIAHASEASPFFGVYIDHSASGGAIGVQLPADKSHLILKPAGVVLRPPGPWEVGSRTRDNRHWSDATVKIEKVFTDASGQETKGRCDGSVAILVGQFSPYHDTRLLDGLDKEDHATFVREQQNLDKYIPLFIEQQKAEFDKGLAKMTKTKAANTRFEVFSANGWSGYIIETKPCAEDSDSNFGSSVQGTLFRYGLKLSFTGSATGYIRNPAVKDWSESIVRQLHAQIPAILGSFSFPPIDLDARAKEKLAQEESRLRVVIGSSRNGGLRPGESCELTATASGGKPPYRYTWTGVTSTTPAATFNQSKVGRHDVSVTVTDASQQNANGMLTLTVSPVLAKIAGMPTQPYFPGQTVNLRAEVEGLPLDSFRCQWAVGPQGIISVLEGIAELPIECRTMAGTRIGLTLIPKNGDEVIAEAAPVILQPVLPQFGVTFDPMNAKPGDEVLVTVTPSLEAAKPFFEFKWGKPASGERLDYEDTARVIGFRVKDAKPVPVNATIHAVSSGEEVGKLSATYMPSNYQVTAKVVGPANRGPQPMVWIPGQGLAPAPQGTYGTDEIVLVRADIAPALADDAGRWRWTANEGTNILSSELAREIRVVRSSPGDAALTVTATTPENIQLGCASASFTVAAAETVKNPKPPVISLATDATEILLGKTALLTAGVREGKPPFTFAWSGSVVPQDHLAVLFGRTAGRQAISVRVTDALGKSAAATIAIDVRRPTLRVFLAAEGLDQPSANGSVTLSAGQSLAVEAQVEGGAAPFKFAWSGPVQGSGAKATCTAPDEPGASEGVKVVVTDSAGVSASATLLVTTPAGLLPRSRQAPGKPPAASPSSPPPAAPARPSVSTKSPVPQNQAREEDKFAGGKARAKELRDAGAKLQQAGDLAGAIAKYRESLKLYPDPRLEEHIKKLETARQR